MYFLYILECADQSLYTGITLNLEKRLKEHNTSKSAAKYTAARRPVKIVFSKEFGTKAEALREEFRVKKLPREDKLALIATVKS